MRIDRTISRLKEADADSPELRRVARDIGHELHHDRMAVLATLSAALAQEAGEQDSEFVSGYKAALGDLVAAYLASAQVRDDERVARDWLLKKKWAPEIAALLTLRPMTLSDIALDLGVGLSTVSRVARQMRQLRIVEGLRSHDGRSRWQQLTMLGEQLT